jgi:hypothetical protein
MRLWDCSCELKKIREEWAIKSPAKGFEAVVGRASWLLVAWCFVAGGRVAVDE